MSWAGEVDRAVGVLRSGGQLAFPTETVHSLAARFEISDSAEFVMVRG
jgi:tRNA A37 threonylcarbamoyladenosine synthetase subunit TsaC/SUA5/YrdC